MIHLVLMAPEIPGNTGNIGRTCLAAGAHLHLVEPLGFDLSDAAVRRAGLDYWKHVSLTVHPDLQAAAASIPGFEGALWFSKYAKRSFYDQPIPNPAVLVFGSESKGFGDHLRAEHAERLVGLPILSDKIRSLNLANAAAIALYETLRRSR
jgi:tRNA (cytidine/uridine-2'-O-)-methyltransferase